MKKFEFTGETKTISLFFRTATLHRIRAVAEFGLVKIGDLGGWIEKEENLSHEGKAWVCGDAKVWGNAKVCGDAKVSVIGVKVPPELDKQWYIDLARKRLKQFGIAA